MSPSLSREALTARVIEVIVKTQKLPPGSVTPDQTFADLKIDSLDGINILFALEGEFNLDIPDAAANEIRSVEEAVNGIEKLLAAGDGAEESAAASGREPSAPA